MYSLLLDQLLREVRKKERKESLRHVTCNFSVQFLLTERDVSLISLVGVVSFPLLLLLPRLPSLPPVSLAYKEL